MNFKQTELPYDLSALEPHISRETLEYHYGKHHKTYVDKLNALIKDTDFENKSLEDIIRSSQGPIFNNAAQVYNHSFYWNCLTPNSNKSDSSELIAEIENQFGSFENFQNEFNDKAVNNFGSSWTWLVKNSDNKLSIINTSNAATPLCDNLTPILVVDLWEHAYYIDFRNVRPNYLNAFWQLVNWQYAEKNWQMTTFSISAQI